MKLQFKSSTADLAELYDYFIFDIWGVLHDGLSAYKGAIEALRFLKNKNKKICLLSNAPRRAYKASKFLEKIGISRDLYDFILTSGEAAYLDLQHNQQSNFVNFGPSYIYIGPQKDIELLEGLNYFKSEELTKADFALTTGFDYDNSKIEEKLPLAKECLKNNLPLICVNPDLIVVRQSGQEVICAGALAREYEKMDGKVHYYGKPFQKVYEIVYQFFAKDNHDIAKHKIIAIGDGIETDIKGARDFGIDMALVTGGILCNQLGVKYGEQCEGKKLLEICNHYGIFPTFVIPKI
jgi:HAD superfamily hydrolase (TIGR01459 family)